jgi:hypothetical protein
MSEWITYRMPDHEDMFSGLVWGQVKDGTPCLREWSEVKRGEPWMPIKEPEPYVKPEPQRWKPKDGNGYYIIRSSGIVVYTISHDTLSNECTYNFGNCFQTSEQAIEAARRVRETLLNYHKELQNDQMES